MAADVPAGTSAETPGDVRATSLLPDVVRQRLVALTADALEHLHSDTLPPPLRPVLSFARPRRLRLAAAPIAAALDDDDFRTRVAAQVRPTHAGLAAALDDGLPVAADPVEVAALTYLLRPAGWTVTLAAALARLEQPEPVSSDPPQTARVQERLDAARAELDSLRAAHREQVTALKGENTELRRRLASERTGAKRARHDVEGTLSELTRARADAERRTVEGQAERRRLQARLDDLTGDRTVARSADREARAKEAVRARLLLDTLVEAAQGLRRELALPPVQTRPADTVDGVAAGLPLGRTVARALASDDPALLRELVALPEAHLLVDGYNVTKLGWPATALDAQRARLSRELGPLAARSGAEVTVVFDGAELAHPPRISPPRGIRVRFSPPDVTADEVLIELVRAEPAGRPLVVVSSDAEVVAGVERAGARAVPSAALLALLGSRGGRTVSRSG